MKKDAKLLIVVPRYVERFGDYYNFPLGLGYIASALKKAGFNTYALNLNHELGDEFVLVKKMVNKLSIDVCLTGGLSPFITSINDIFKGARAGNNNVVNIAGGGIVSSDPEIVFSLFDLDYGVIGEGEITVVELIHSLIYSNDVNDVCSIVYKGSNNNIVRTADRDTNKNLDELPWPDYELLGFGKDIENQKALDDYFFHAQPDSNPRSIVMISSRSCPFMCTFCFHPVGKVYRERSLDDFFAELEHHIDKYSINMVSIQDELFSLRKKRLIDFCGRIKNLGIQWMVQLHVRTSDKEILEMMHSSGCVYISYGVESVNEKVLKSMEKKATRSQVDGALKRTYESKIGIQGNLIFGDNAETIETANDTMKWWSDNRKYLIWVSRLQIFPGSPDYISSVRSGIINDRVTFSKDLPIDVNTCSMSDIDYEMLMFIRMVYGRTILAVVKDTTISKDPYIDSVRGELYVIQWKCDSCGHKNIYKSVAFLPEHKYFIRMTCRECRSRHDVVNTYYSNVSQYDDLDSKLLYEYSSYAVIPELSDLLFDKNIYDLPVEFKQSMKKEKDEISEVGNYLLTRPFSCLSHIMFANILLKSGIVGGALLHYTQAKKMVDNLYVKEEVCSIDKLDLLIRGLKNLPDSSVFFKSFEKSRESDLNKITVEYVNKVEPSFPDY